MPEQNNKRVLIVEDEEMNRKVLNGYLKKSGYETVCAEDGAQAMEILQKDRGFDVIVLDRMMPVMDGMEVLSKLQADEELKQIPVIMQTAAASTQKIKEGIDAGVFYYMTKPFSKEVLLSIVQSAINNTNNKNELISEVSKVHKSLGLMDISTFRFRTLKEAQNLSYLIANACPNPQEVILGISELMVNAIEHGNLGITYEEKSQLLRDDAWHDEINKRLKHSSFIDIQARINFERKGDIIELIIQDEGKGFDWQDFMEISPSRATDPNGRGIAMANNVSFYKIEYKGVGNIVHCSILLKDDSPNN